MGRKNRPYYRVCAIDIRRPQGGRVLEELGSYDPLIRETDARAILNGERIAFWMERGAEPTPKVETLIKKYGKGGTHVGAQQQAIERLGQRRAKSIQAAITAAANAPKAPEPSAAPAEETAPEAPASGESAGGDEAAG
jgi:small subunit ribosomal protein S16